jgi:periplasmic divalent cation tolerance protein
LWSFTYSPGSMNDTDRPIIVMVTTASESEAATIARALVESNLAAGVNFTPIKSIYRWQGQIYNEPEYQLLIQSQLSKFPALEAKVKSLHSYQVPEIIAIPIVAGHQPYLDWIAET